MDTSRCWTAAASLVILASCHLACEHSTPAVADAGAGGPDLTCGDGLKLYDATCVVALATCGGNEVPTPAGGCKQIGVETCEIDGQPGIKAPGSTCNRVGVQECKTKDGGRGIKGPPNWTCTPIGPPTTCLTGWSKVAGGWCEPVLPTTTCPDNEREVIGQTKCQPVGDCGSGTYGAIKLTANTLFVDQASTASPADGSQAKPFPTIGEALHAAAAGAQIAVAAGTYKEDLLITKQVSLRGRCAELVTVQGQGQAEDAAAVGIAASNVEVSGLTVSGPSHGIGIHGATGVTVEETAVLRCGAQGIVMRRTSQTNLTDLLISDNVGGGVLALGASAKLVSSTVRRTGPRLKLVVTPGDNSILNASIAVGSNTSGGVPSKLSIEQSVIIDNRDLAAATISSALTLSQSVVARTRTVQLEPPRGQSVIAIGQGSEATLEVHDSLLTHNRGSHIVALGAKVIVEQSVLTSTLPTTSGPMGQGPGIQAVRHKGSPSTLTVKRSLIRDSLGENVVVRGSKAQVERSILEKPRMGMWSGDGLMAIYEDGEASATVRECLVADSLGAGVSFLFATGAVQRSVIRGTRPANGVWGCGIMGAALTEYKPWPRSVVTIEDCTVKNNAMAGLWSTDAYLKVSRTLIEDTQPAKGRTMIGPGQQEFGYGVQLNSFWKAGRAKLEMSYSIVRDNYGQGIAAHGAEATIERSVVRDTKAITPDYQPGIGILASYGGWSPLGVLLGVRPLTVRDSLVDSARYVGIASYHSPATIERTIVRDTQPQTFHGGDPLGLGVYAGPAPGPLGSLARASLTMVDSALLRSSSTGLLLGSAKATVSGCRIEDTRSVKGALGDGVAATSDLLFGPGNLLLEDSQVIRSARAGVLYQGGGGAVRRCEITGGQFSIVLDGASPIIGEHNFLHGNTDDRLRTNQALSLPAGPELPPAPI